MLPINHWLELLFNKAGIIAEDDEYVANGAHYLKSMENYRYLNLLYIRLIDVAKACSLK